MSTIGERLFNTGFDKSMKLIDNAVRLAADLTDHLEPKIVDVQGTTMDEFFQEKGYRQVLVGPFSGSVITRDPEEVIRHFGAADRGFAFKIRQAAHQLRGQNG